MDRGNNTNCLCKIHAVHRSVVTGLTKRNLQILRRVFEQYEDNEVGRCKITVSEDIKIFISYDNSAACKYTYQHQRY
jgi:hypothetical protein